MKRHCFRHKGFTLVELMVVIAIIGILAAIAVPKIQKQVLAGRLENAKPYMASIAARLKETRNQYGSFLAGNETVYRDGGTYNSQTYAAHDEQFLEDFLGVNLRDASDFCFRVQLSTATNPDVGAKGEILVNSDAAFEVWAVLRDTTYTSSENDAINLTDGATGTCVTAGDGTNADDKLLPAGWFDGLEGTIVVYKYPPPANNLYWSDGYRMDNPLGEPLGSDTW